MSEKRVIDFNGEQKTVTVVSADSSQEYWNQYLLSDGTVLKLKTVVKDVVRVDGEYDGNGNPIYAVNSVNVLASSCPENLKGGK